MRVVAVPIEMIASFSKEGIPRPVRFRMMIEDESEKVINVQTIIEKEKTKLNGVMFFNFRCQSIIDERQLVYELIFEINTCKWVLYKI